MNDAYLDFIFAVEIF